MAGGVTDQGARILLNVLLNPVAGLSSVAGGVGGLSILGPTRQIGLLTYLGNVDSSGDYAEPAQPATSVAGYRRYTYGPTTGSDSANGPWASEAVFPIYRYRNSQALTFPGLPACTVVGWMLIDPDSDPFYGCLLKAPFATPSNIPAGGSFYIPVNTLLVSMD